MPNLIKKSWTVSNGGLLKCIMDETQAKHVTMVDLDEIVMEACALHMRNVCGNYLDKSQRKGDRYHVITGDALYFMEEHSTMAPVCNISQHKFISQLFFFKFKIKNFDSAQKIKGQLISKCPFVVTKSTKKTNKIVRISALGSKKRSNHKSSF